jgi:mRNA-degrading endonuclease toxin of MazEF toxin-antitoxin module
MSSASVRDARRIEALHWSMPRTGPPSGRGHTMADNDAASPTARPGGVGATGSAPERRQGVVGRFRGWQERRRRKARTTRHDQPGFDDARLEDVRVVYEPCVDGDPDPGEVVWAWVPYEEDKTQGKDRPVIVIARHGAALAAVQLTTRGAGHDDNVFVGAGEWDPQRRDSWAKLDRIVQIDPSTVRRTDHVLGRDRFDEVVAALRQQHGFRVEPPSSAR